MKGTVVATWIQTAKKLWGEDVVAAVMEQNGWPAGRKIMAPSDNIVLNPLYRNAFALDEILQHLRVWQWRNLFPISCRPKLTRLATLNCLQTGWRQQGKKAKTKPCLKV